MKRRPPAERWSGYLFLAPYFALFGAFVVAPLVFGLVLSFFRWEMLSESPARLVGLGNFREALGDPYFWKATRATALFVVLTVPGTIVIATAIALGLHRLGRGNAAFRAAYFLPVMVNISVAGILWRWLLSSEFGLFNAYLARFGVRVPWITSSAWAMPSIVFMTLWWTAGAPAVILLAGLKQIPNEYYEAAAVDGAGAVDKFFRITLPLLRPVLLFVLVLNIIGSFQVFGQTFMITRGGPELSTRVLVQYIYETAFNHYRMGYGAAMSWLLFAMIAVFSVAQFRVMRGADHA